MLKLSLFVGYVIRLFVCLFVLEGGVHRSATSLNQYRGFVCGHFTITQFYYFVKYVTLYIHISSV